MKDTVVITSIKTQVQIPATILEDIVQHRVRATKYHYPVSKVERDIYCRDIETFLTYSIESTVKGNMQIQFSREWESIETLKFPVAASFLVTCIQRGDGNYKMKFISSMN